MIEENCFQLLELDPRTATDQDIKLAIESKRRLWSRTPPGPKGVQFQKYRESLEEIRSVMMDPTRRAAEAASFIGHHEKERTDAIETATERLKIMGAKGFVTQEDVERLLTNHGGALTKEDLRLIVEGLGIEVRKLEREESARRRPGLDPATETAIQNWLKVVGNADLYDFLGLPSNASVAQLRAKASQILAQVRREPPTADIKVRGELASWCMSLFSKDEQRALYDESLRLAPVREVLAEAKILVGSSNQLTVAAIERLQRFGLERGLSVVAGEAALREEARDQGWIYVEPDTVECPACRRTSDAGLIYCSHDECVTQLCRNRPCPKCGGDTPDHPKARFCVNCEFELPMTQYAAATG